MKILEEYTIANEYGNWKIIRDSEHGYWKVDPPPSEEYIRNFYEKEYSNAGYSFHDQVYEFILERQDPVLFSKNGQVLEIGCGQGQKLKRFEDLGFKCLGFEPNDYDREVASSLGLEVLGEMFSPSLVEGRGGFDYVLISNVLEHVRDPVRLLEDIHSILSEEGMLLIDVPNDFNALQMNYLENHEDSSPWFIAPPIHLSYFTPKSLISLLNQCNLKVVKRTTRFPMEIFLLFGEDYIRNPDLGKECHEKRVNFERSFIPENLAGLWDFYDSLASGGFGRELIYICQKNKIRLDLSKINLQEKYAIEYLSEDHLEKIRVWRNQQMEKLRQSDEISKKQQKEWFDRIVIPENNSHNPKMILFGFFCEKELIGYGGLTNISWPDRRAEVSFLMSTEKSDDSETYDEEMTKFLALMKDVATNLGISKLVSETYSFREKHLQILEREGFVLEGKLAKHSIQNGNFVDSLYHSWINRG